ncbi:hypothetical protein RRG08_066436 [Elysia crispata]|uniref:ShKT domain-containing protein n=1 Tax=Elysia crispata TaxID=231223 RepID=A0AAE0Z878_9GAST|nr:hypothetical protein RRG08_066436 [Elysia crispata]
MLAKPSLAGRYHTGYISVSLAAWNALGLFSHYGTPVWFMVVTSGYLASASVLSIKFISSSVKEFYICVFQLSNPAVDLCEGGACLNKLHHGPYQSVGEIRTLIDLSEWNCDPTKKYCKIKIQDQKIEATCHTWDHFDHDCRLSQWQNTDVCNLDLTQSGQHYRCQFCCSHKSCAYRFDNSTNIPSSSTLKVPTTVRTTVQDATNLTSIIALPSTTTTIKTSPPTPTTTTPTTSTTTTKPTTTRTTTLHPIQDFLKQPCADVLPNCTAQDCYDNLAPTQCRKFCNLCEYPLLVFYPAVPTIQPLPLTTVAPTVAPPTATKAPPVVTLAPPTVADSEATAPPTIAAPTLPPTPLPKTTQRTVAPPLGCHDKYDNCATQLFVCSSPYASDICQKYCGLCPTTLAPCVDHLEGARCQDLPHTCDNPLTSLTCAKTCGLCCE